jgi:hypothetical protein
MQNVMAQTPMLSTMIFKIVQVNIVKEVELNIIGMSRNLQK